MKLADVRDHLKNRKHIPDSLARRYTRARAVLRVAELEEKRRIRGEAEDEPLSNAPAGP